MSNLQIVADRQPSDGANPFVRLNVIDNGDGTCAVYVEDRPNSDAFSTGAAVPTTGNRVVGSASGTVSGSGTTNQLPKWTNGPGSVLGNSSITDSGALVTVNNPLTSTGAVIGLSFATTSNGSFSVSGSGQFNWGGKSRIISPSDGIIEITNSAATDFNRLQLGGTTSSFPALKRNATGIDIRLADDSAFAPISVSTLTLTGAITFPDGVRQTFNPDATTPGLNVGSFAGDPSTPANADLWYDSTGNQLRARINGATVSLGTASVASVTATNGTLTISPTTGAVLAALNLGNANIWTAPQEFRITDGATNTITNPASLTHNSSGTPVAGYGVGLLFKGSNSSIDGVDVAQVAGVWTDAQVGLQTSDVVFYSVLAGAALAEKTRIRSNGYLLPAGGQARTTAQFDKTTSTALANVTGLSVSVAAGRTYSFRAVVFMDADAVGGIKLAIAGTATATAVIYQINAIANTTNANAINSRQTALGGAGAGAVVGTETLYFATIEGTITVNAAGTLTVQFAQNVSNGTSSVLVGSTFIVREIL